ncbi:MAG: rRNA maturation RNase YbeY [Chloroflexota bacterium]|nr:MAG: rRNA maturation RNase YbeY [Chloroflexota bacterium]
MTVLLDLSATYSQHLDQALIERTVLATLKHQGISPDADLSVVITDDTRLHQLNRDFLGIDAPTDVLSFPAGHTDPDTNRKYLGDVIISFPTACRQADQFGHSISSEITLLIVHGILHLLGHDHMKPGEKSSMWSAQTEILDSLGLDIKSPEFFTESEG